MCSKTQNGQYLQTCKQKPVHCLENTGSCAALSKFFRRQIRANFRQMCNLTQFDKRCKIMDKKEVVDLVTSSPMLISHATFLLCQGWERPKKNLPFLHFFKRVVLKCALKVKHLPSLRFTYWVLKLLIVEFVGKNDP